MLSFSVTKRLPVSRIARMSSLINPHLIVDQTELFLFDCDGVVWKGTSPIEGAAGVIDKLRKCGKIVKFVTNNSMKSRVGFVKKFKDMGIDVTVNDVYSGSSAAASYLSAHPMLSHQKAFVIGHAGIEEELALHNIPYISGAQFNDTKIVFGPGARVTQDPNVGAVVVGIDLDINYYKIQYAQLCLNLNENCRFIATNSDRVAHVTDAQEWAAAGATVGAIKGCTNREPILVGKPSSYLIDHIIEEYRVDRNKICMVGDNLDTDILFGLQNSLKTVLTMSGVTDEDRLAKCIDSRKPHYVVNSINDLI